MDWEEGRSTTVKHAEACDRACQLGSAPEGKSCPSQRMDRRAALLRCLGMGAGALAAALSAAWTAPGAAVVEAAASRSGTSSRAKHRYAMVIDTRRCVGCKACMVACKAENKTPPGVSYTVVTAEPPEAGLSDKPLYMTKPCFHCEEAPCTRVCPVSATFKREDDGIVVVDYDRCIGCRYCIAACPYGARFFDFGEDYPAVAEGTPYAAVPSPELKQFRKREKEVSPIGNVRKCTFCLHLQDENGEYDRRAGRWPACAKTCTGHAIHFGDLLDAEDEIVRLLNERNHIRLKEEWGTEPNVFYLL